MEKYELDKSDDSKIISIIEKIIVSKHPILEDVYDTVTDYESPVMDIIINFNVENTSINFLDGTHITKSNIDEQLQINGVISSDTINKLIEFIYNDHDRIVDLTKISKRIEMKFHVNILKDSLKGISCGEIRLVLDFSKYPDNQELMDNYFDAITSRYESDLIDTSWYRDKCKKSLDILKSYIIDHYDLPRFQKFVSSINNGMLCNIIVYQMPRDMLVELLAESKKEESKAKTLDLKKK